MREWCEADGGTVVVRLRVAAVDEFVVVMCLRREMVGRAVVVAEDVAGPLTQGATDASVAGVGWRPMHRSTRVVEAQEKEDTLGPATTKLDPWL